MMAAGTKHDPWVLKTPPGTSEYTMYRECRSTPPSREGLSSAHGNRGAAGHRAMG
ncbi:MAG: DUF6855 family protein [Streptosporangiaceae bacterium]